MDIVDTNDLSAIPPEEAPCLTVASQNHGNNAGNVKTD